MNRHNNRDAGKIKTETNLTETTTMETIITSNTSLPSILRSRSAIILCAFALIAFVLTEKTQAVTPPPDGGYPGANTAEGNFALFSLTNGQSNTAIGFNALGDNTTGNVNTATALQALALNPPGSQNTDTV